MTNPTKVVQFSTYQKPQEFFPSLKNGEKIAYQGDSEKNAETPGNKGVSAIPATPLKGNSGKKVQTQTKKKKKAHAEAQKPTVIATPGPEGYKTDCATMKATPLGKAYKREYTSWAARKRYCKVTEGFVWAPEWNIFRDFLLSMKPMPGPGTYTLERVKNHVTAYGPDLCIWATKVEQNNNKSDNVKIVEPLTGREFSVQQLAKIQGVKAQTIYKRRADWHWSDLELLVGKKLPHLHPLIAALNELPPPSPKGKKVLQPFELSAYVPPGDWEPIEDDWEHFLDTGEERSTHAMRRREEYDAVAAWMSTVNAGLPVPPWPQLKYLKMNPPTPERMARLYKPLPTKPKAVPYWPNPYFKDEDDFDPADCMPDPDSEDDD